VLVRAAAGVIVYAGALVLLRAWPSEAIAALREAAHGDAPAAA
jgi:hypothetical protein